MMPEADHLASVLARARSTVTPVDGTTAPWPDMDAALASEVGASLCRLIGAEGSPYWKLGATDVATQTRLGVPGPLFAPLDPASVRRDVVAATLDRSTMIAPRFEPEIGVMWVDGVIFASPCVEIADCRFSGWRLPPWGVVADATLQGEMLFGPPVAPQDDVEVTVRLDGREIGRGCGTWREAVARLDLLPQEASAALVATGSLTSLFDCEPGVWNFDFGPLGALTVSVV